MRQHFISQLSSIPFFEELCSPEQRTFPPGSALVCDTRKVQGSPHQQTVRLCTHILLECPKLPNPYLFKINEVLCQASFCFPSPRGSACPRLGCRAGSSTVLRGVFYVFHFACCNFQSTSAVSLQQQYILLSFRAFKRSQSCEWQLICRK